MTSKEPGRVAIFLPDLGGGGAERCNVILANEFASRGVEVDLVVYNADGPFARLVADDVRLVVLGCRRLETSLLPFCRYVMRERPSVVMASMQHAGIVALLAKRLVGKGRRFIVQYQNTISRDYATFGPAGRFWLRLLGLLLPSADAVVAVSKQAAQDIVDTFPRTAGNILYIYNAVSEDAIAQLVDEPVTHPWFHDPGTPVMLSAGRLVPLKNYQSLLDAFSRVLRVRPARLIIIGEGTDRSRLVSRAKELGITDSVDFAGFQANPYSFMKNARVFVLSSLQEGLPLVLIEALACGTPVVSTDCPSGPREVLEGGKWGRLVPVGDSRALADAMLATLDDPEDSAALVERARRFSARTIADEYLRLFLELRGRERRASSGVA